MTQKMITKFKIFENIDGADPYNEEDWNDYEYIDVIDDNIPKGAEICIKNDVIGKVYDYEYDHKSIYIEFYRNMGFNPIKKIWISALKKAGAKYKIKK